MTLAEEVTAPRKQVRELEKGIRRLKEGSTFFAASRQKSARNREWG